MYINNITQTEEMAHVTEACTTVEEFQVVPEDRIEKNVRPMSESDLIDSLFYTCDVERTGQVCISRLIEYLKFTTSNISENDEDLSHLAYMLDSSGTDSMITIGSYRGIMKTWIDNIRIRNNSDCDDVFHYGTAEEKDGRSSHLIQTPGGDLQNHQVMEEDRAFIEQNNGIRHNSLDAIELQHRISDLRHQNRKLTEENVKLQQQLESQEEALATSATETESIKQKIKSLQEIVELRQDTQQENEELKLSISKLQEKKKEQENKLNLLERENSLLDSKNAELEKMVHAMGGQLENLKGQNQEQHVSLVEHKHRLLQVQEVKTMQEIQLNERYNELKALQKQVECLSKTADELRQERSDLQFQCTQAQQELTSLQSKIERFGIQEPCDEGMVHQDMFLASLSSSHPARLACSTPLKANNSICFELRNMLEIDKPLPSPLCAKEFFDEVLGDGASLTEIDEDDISSLEEEDISVSAKDDLTMDISKFADKYRQKQQDLLDDIDSHLKSFFSNSDKEVSAHFQTNLRAETDKLTQKVISLAKAKEMADTRIMKLKGKIKKLKENNRLIQTAHQNTRNVLVKTGVDLETNVDNRLMILKDTVDKERSYVKMLEKELAEKKRVLTLMGNFQDGNEPVPNIDTLLKDIDHLKRANLDLTEKYQKSELQVRDIEDELYRSKEELEAHKIHCDDLEENLASCKLARQLDLRDIWRLVHKDVEKECIEEQKDTSLLDASDNLKEQISQEIKTLKTQLYKRQAALGLLTNKSTGHHPPIYQSCSCFGNYSGSSNASSPLVEALTIDFFNGNQPSYKCKKGAYIGSSEMDLVSNYGCEKCQSLSNSNWKFGNASHGNRSQPQRQQSQGENNNNSQTNLNKSVSSSSTSGAADLDLSTSTLKSTDGRTRRKEFQNLRWESDDIICRSTESQSSSATDGGVVYHISGDSGGDRTVDHNDNMYDPSMTNNLRRWSFNAAIANQNYASDDMVHYPRCRSQSFQAAIESGQQTPLVDSDNNPENMFGSAFASSIDSDSSLVTNEKYTGFTKICVCGNHSGKCSKCEVSRCSPAQFNGSSRARDNFMKNIEEGYGLDAEPVDDYCWNDNMDPNSDYSSLSFSHLSYTSTPVCHDTTNDNRSSPKLTRKLSILVEEDDVLSETDAVPTPKLTSGQSYSVFYHSKAEFSPQSKKKSEYSTDHERDSKRQCVTTSPGNQSLHSLRQRTTEDHSFRVCSDAVIFHQPYRSWNQDNSGTESCSSLELSTSHTEAYGECQAQDKPVRLKNPIKENTFKLKDPEKEKTLKDKETENTCKLKNQDKEQTVKLKDEEAKPVKLKDQEEKTVKLKNQEEKTVKVKDQVGEKTVKLTDQEEKTVKLNDKKKPEEVDSAAPPCSSSQEEVIQEEEADDSATTRLSQQLQKLTIGDKSIDMNKSATKEKTGSLSPSLQNENGQTMKHDIIKESPASHDRTPSPNGQLKTPVDDISPEMRQVGSKLAKIRLEHLNRKRDHMKCSKMPELKEQTSESQSSPVPTTVITVREPSPPETPSDVQQNGDTPSGVLKPPAPSDKPVLPSLPDVFLKKLGLLGGDQKGADQLSEQDIENKFTSLSLAFKTDKLTLEKRLEIQERSRDIAEQNVDKELKGLKESLDTLNHLCTDTQVRDVLRKIQNHVDVLEMSAARVSSRAEVFGAVQQEKRMSKAIEIMLTHVDNIRMVHDRVNTELEDARRMIQDSRPFGGSGDFSSLSRRSASVCQGVQNARITGRRQSETTPRSSEYAKVGRRRISEIQLPRVLGGTGVPSFTHSTSMDTTSLECKSQMLRKDPNDEDAKSRFKQVVANAAIKNAVADSIRRSSVDAKQPSVSITPTTMSRENSTDSKSRDSSDNSLSKQNSKEEEAFQQGFRQGYKAQIGQELKSLREQQTNINTSLEEMMDNCEEPPEEEVRTIKDTVVTKLWDMVPEWEIAGKRLRMTMAGLVLFMALCSIILSFLPIGQANAKVFPEYKHMGQPPL